MTMFNSHHKNESQQIDGVWSYTIWMYEAGEEEEEEEESPMILG